MKKTFILFLLVIFLTSVSLFSQPIFVNEIEYSIDDTPTSTDGIGIFGPVGQDLTGYSVQVVSSSGANVTVIPVTGTIAVSTPVTNRGEIWIEVPVLNVSGGDQGVILIAPGGTVEQFVSFGNANSIITTTVTGIGTVTSEHVGFHIGGKSLQVTGTGCEYADFVASSGDAYINTQAPSHGNTNENQVVDCVDDGSADNVALPAELIRFGGTANTAGVELEWATATERNNDYFTVEHSADGEVFTEIYRVGGQGNTEKMHIYTYTDTEAEKGINYYRLKQTDFDGTETYFRLIQVDLITANAPPQIYPNPAGESLTIRFIEPGAADFTLEIYDAVGKKVAQVQVSGYAESVEIDVSDLAKGMYFIKADRGESAVRQSFVKR